MNRDASSDCLEAMRLFHHSLPHLQERIRLSDKSLGQAACPTRARTRGLLRTAVVWYNYMRDCIPIISYPRNHCLHAVTTFVRHETVTSTTFW
jgi:hypothetical protein